MRTSSSARLRWVAAAALSGLCAGSLPAAIVENDRFRLFGDFRTRLESDFDSRTADGADRDDRLRLRVRARLGLEARATERLTLGLRLRSGSENSHQSPHVTVVDFDENDTGDADFALDRWYLGGEWRRGWAWTGRRELPFWKRNELYWDDDVTVAGVAGGIEGEVAGGTLQAIGGHFSLPVGMTRFAGRSTGLQVVYGRDGARSGARGGLAWIGIDADRDDPDAARLLSGNGLRDYRLLVASVEIRLSTRGRPLTFGADVVRNLESYSPSDPDPVTARLHDETDGLVVSLASGGVRERGDWLTAYTYARIEGLAVNASYAQDDWMRWGSAVETRASDFSGHELRFGYGLEKNLNLIARLYLVESITTAEDGKRFRIDLNLSL